MVTRRRGSRGRNHGGGANRQFNCRRRSRLFRRPQPSQECQALLRCVCVCVCVWGGGVLRERARRHIFPLVETIPELPREPPSQRWQKLGKEMGEINMGLVNEKKNHRPLWCLPTFTRTFISKFTSTGV